MQSKNPVLDDLARLASGALGAASGLRDEVEAMMRERFARMLEGMELVNREEFEAVRAMAAKARSEQERLAARVAELEAQLAARRTPAKPAKRKAAPAKSARRPAKGAGGGRKPKS